MPDTETTALIERLQRSNRRWKRLALSLMAALGLALVLLTTSTMVLWVRAERQARQAEAAEKQVEDHFARSIQNVMKKGREVYADEIKPVLEVHPTRRDPTKVQAIFPVLEKQKRELTFLADELARAGPYHSPEAEEAHEVGRQYVLAGIELFNMAEHVLHQGVKRTDKDRQALRAYEQQIEERRREWKKLLQ